MLLYYEATFHSGREHTIFTKLLTTILVLMISVPGVARAQSGDASWLENIDGLELAIGRSWMAPIVFTEVTTLTELNEAGTPVSETMETTQSTPVGELTPDMQTISMSVLVYQFDSAEHAAQGVDIFNDDQMAQIERDPRAPATNEFDPELGDKGYGHEGIYSYEGPDGNEHEIGVVMLFVQQDELVYQLFGQYVPGNHVEISTNVIADMLDAEIGTDEPVYDLNGASTGGLWEKLNAIDIAMPEGSTINDLEIYPPSDDAVMGDSVVVPEIDLANLGDVPGLVGSWYIGYGPAQDGTPVATPITPETGAFSIELWVMEFEDSTEAAAAAFSMNAVLTAPLGIVTTEGRGFDPVEGMTFTSTGFVQDQRLPEGDASVVVHVEGNMLYAARVYTRDLAPQPVAEELVARLQGQQPDAVATAESELVPSDDMWDYFPQEGDDSLRGLVPIVVRHDMPSGDPATPVG